MIYKIIFFTLLLTNFVFADVQKIRIGSIDDYYKNKITNEELRSIIDEIEDTLESQLGYDVFNYSQNGKPIYIKYVPPLKLEKEIQSKIVRLEKKKKKIDTLRDSLPSAKTILEKHQKSINTFTLHLNKKTDELNRYVRSINKKKHLTLEQYKQAQVHVKSKQKRINRDTHVLKQDRRSYKKKLHAYNSKIHKFNNAVREYNMLQNQLERMNKSFTKVKGRAFGITETTLKTYYKDGKKIKEKTVSNTMTKIEIYGFETIDKLRAVLAHEIGHLVGIPHIHNKEALMHPFLQENQINTLLLTPEDIDNFNKNF